MDGGLHAHHRRFLSRKRFSDMCSLICVPLITDVKAAKLLSLRMVLLNVRSISNKSFALNKLITKESFDFMFLTETWQQGLDFIAQLHAERPLGRNRTQDLLAARQQCYQLRHCAALSVKVAISNWVRS
ncbi:hypothetical protein CHARACLAT_028845 [Characodon lateralis]|uniref:Uncharacterized protein n=1 Tax=Characodon lateralis TaxID=208331 RepID=A0ABU7F9Z9_9TELE|nr:hypothetical protein [Characodon lateralis]